MLFELLNENIYFIQLSHFSNELKMFHLSKIFFYKKPAFLHFHVDQENKEQSILISEDVIDEFIPFLNGSEMKIYKCLQIINTEEYLTESGLVFLISSKFTNYNIPILYITTFKSNFVLFDSEYLEIVSSFLDIDL